MHTICRISECPTCFNLADGDFFFRYGILILQCQQLEDKDSTLRFRVKGCLAGSYFSHDFVTTLGLVFYDGTVETARVK